jgi:hypothetical protein
MRAFPRIVIIHPIGMGFLAGTRGRAPDPRVSQKWCPVLWLALAASAVRGVLLLIVQGAHRAGGEARGDG